MIGVRRKLWSAVLLTTAILVAGCDGEGGSSSSSLVVETLAGGNIGDGLPATDAPIAATGVEVDRVGNVLLADHGRIRRIRARDGRIETVVGNGRFGTCGEGGRAVDACLVSAIDLALDGHEKLFVTDSAEGRVLRIDRATGTARRIAQLRRPTTIAIAADGRLFVTDSDDGRIFRLDPDGTDVTAVAGNGDTESGADDCLDDLPATGTCIRYGGRLAVDGAGGLLIAGGGGYGVRRVDPATGIMQRTVGRRGSCDSAERGDGGPATEACLQGPVDVAVDANGDLLVADFGDARIRRVDADSGLISTVADRFEGPFVPYALAFAPDGDLITLRADPVRRFRGNLAVRIDVESGGARVIGGNGTRDACGDGGAARDACLEDPRDVAVGLDGAIFVAGSRSIRRIDPTYGTIITVAGNDELAADDTAACPDEVAATATCLSFADQIVVGPDGSLFVIEQDYSIAARSARIRRIDAVRGTITTVAGGCPIAESIDEPVDGAVARGACFFPVDLAVGSDGDVMFVTRAGLWRVEGATGRLRRIAGGFSAGVCADGLATGPCLSPLALALAPDGDALLLDGPYDEGQRIRRIDLATGSVVTIAGTGRGGNCGDGGAAIDACLSAGRIAVGANGDVFVGGNGSVRRIDAATAVIDTVAGDPVIPAGSDGGIAYSGAFTVSAIDREGRLLYLEWMQGTEGVLLRRLTLPRAARNPRRPPL